MNAYASRWTLLLVLLAGGVHAAQPEIPTPDPEWPSVAPGKVGLDARQLQAARRYAESAGGSGMVVRHGKVVLRWGDQQRRYDIKSATKSFGATMLGVAMKDGKIRLDAPARNYHRTLGTPPPSNAQSGWLDQITIRQLATHTAGFEKRGGYESLLFKPGTQWHYSDGGPNWLAECITLIYRRDLEDVMFDRVFTPLGIDRDDLRWRDNQYRDHQIDGIPRREFGAGIHANVEALSRLGWLYLRKGRWNQDQIIEQSFVKTATAPQPDVVGLPEWKQDDHGNASDHYGLLWWNNADGTLKAVPRDAYWAWGLYDSLIVVIPSLDLVAVRGGARGRSWTRGATGNHYDVLKPFLEPIVAACDQNKDTVSGSNGDSPPATLSAASPNPSEVPPSDFGSAPVPASDFIRKVEWAPKASISRLARGSDNWPITWADDGQLYTAYGDGWGFEPRTEKKLSLGLARVHGRPPDIRGENIRSESVEQLGDGPRGKKASGLLMVQGVLYMWARNADHSQLAWSSDRGQRWTWASWRWETSFGCPTFLNFGKNYAGARDDFVYVYSLDSDTAYEAADQMVLARVPKDRIAERSAYEFFVRIGSDRQPQWTQDVRQRGAVFQHRGRCYRSAVTYNSGLGRYLWCQTLPQSDDARGPRFQGGFGIYDAAEPWGPWTTVYFTPRWDVGPGETSSLPTKWMDSNGQTVHLVFSGDDHFSVRKARLILTE